MQAISRVAPFLEQKLELETKIRRRDMSHFLVARQLSHQPCPGAPPSKSLALNALTTASFLQRLFLGLQLSYLLYPLYFHTIKYGRIRGGRSEQEHIGRASSSRKELQNNAKIVQ